MLQVCKPSEHVVFFSLHSEKGGSNPMTAKVLEALGRLGCQVVLQSRRDERRAEIEAVKIAVAVFDSINGEVLANNNAWQVMPVKRFGSPEWAHGIAGESVVAIGDGAIVSPGMTYRTAQEICRFFYHEVHNAVDRVEPKAATKPRRVEPRVRVLTRPAFAI